jgi:hypothetical protein
MGVIGNKTSGGDLDAKTAEGVHEAETSADILDTGILYARMWSNL